MCLPHNIVYHCSAAENICSVIFPKRLGQLPHTSSIFRISYCAPQDKFIVNLYWDSKHSDSNYLFWFPSAQRPFIITAKSTRFRRIFRIFLMLFSFLFLHVCVFLPVFLLLFGVSFLCFIFPMNKYWSLCNDEFVCLYGYAQQQLICWFSLGGYESYIFSNLHNDNLHSALYYYTSFTDLDLTLRSNRVDNFKSQICIFR